MSILLSGDYHLGAGGENGNSSIKYLETLFDKEQLDSIKFQIILGDSGFLWPGTSIRENSFFSEFPWPVLFIPGNHEPVLGRQLSDFEEIDLKFNNPVYNILKNVYYMPRGKIYNIDNKKILALGGALSIDKHHRKLGTEWWPEEYWSDEEKDNLLELLEQDNTFDLVVSHTGPTRINNKLFEFDIMPYKLNIKIIDEVAIMNNKIEQIIETGNWYSGHMHVDTKYYCSLANRTYYYLYRKPILIE